MGALSSVAETKYMVAPTNPVLHFAVSRIKRAPLFMEEREFLLGIESVRWGGGGVYGWPI